MRKIYIAALLFVLALSIGAVMTQIPLGIKDYCAEYYAQPHPIGFSLDCWIPPEKVYGWPLNFKSFDGPNGTENFNSDFLIFDVIIIWLVLTLAAAIIYFLQKRVFKSKGKIYKK